MEYRDPAPAQREVLHAEEHKRVFKANRFTTSVLLAQLALIVLYGTCTVFDDSTGTLQPLPLRGKVGNVASSWALPLRTASPSEGQMDIQYSMFQDTHVMMLLGFGFLYTLMRRYAWSGVGFNYLITVITLQWAILVNGFWTNVHWRRHLGADVFQFPPIPITIGSFVNADYVVATLLISFGAVIGRVTPFQCLFIAFWGTIFASVNVSIGFEELKVTDPGGSMYIHVFGAAFGLAMSYVLGDRSHGKQAPTSRHNGTFAMIGTLFLFCYWPSFNAAMLVGGAQQRAVINTLLSICASATGSFAISRAIGKFDMEHIQNATLAGGIAIGAACDMLTNPWGAIATGFVAGIASTYSFSFLGHWLRKKGLADTCGVASLHFIPGFIGAVASAVAAAGINPGFKDAALSSYPMDFNPSTMFDSFPGRFFRGAVQQGGYQIAVLAISIALAAGSGLVGGLIMRSSWFSTNDAEDFYEDEAEWDVPAEERSTSKSASAAATHVDMVPVPAVAV